MATTSRVAELVKEDTLASENRIAQFISLPAREHISGSHWMRAQLRDLAALTRERPWNRVIIPSGDGLMQALAIARYLGYSAVAPRTRAEVLVLRGGVAYPGTLQQRIKRRLSWHLLNAAPVAVRHHLDQVFVAWHHRRKWSSTEWRLMPDPVETSPHVGKAEARSRLKLPKDALIVGSVGQLDSRKGIDTLIRAFARLGSQSPLHLMLAGKCSAEIAHQAEVLAATSQYAGRVHVLNRWTTDEELRLSIAAMDLVVVAYPGHIGSASIVLRAIAAGRPVLGSPTPWMQRHIPPYSAGWISDPSDIDSFTAALSRAAGEALKWEPSPRTSALLRFCSPENYMAHWVRETVEELGCETPFSLTSPPQV